MCDDNWSNPVILDLGLVRDQLGSSVTVYPGLMGTELYMSPEQLRQEKAAERSDVSGLGVTLILLLTKGKHPFVEVGESVVREVIEERMRDEDWPNGIRPKGSTTRFGEVLSCRLRPDAFRRGVGVLFSTYSHVVEDRRARPRSLSRR